MEREKYGKVKRKSDGKRGQEKESQVYEGDWGETG